MDVKAIKAAYMGEPSCGLKNRTPSSVTLASFKRDTIWKLTPESARERSSMRLEGSPTHHYLYRSAS
jgi:hypothetical protein